jgi:YHS domain-containing protein
MLYVLKAAALILCVALITPVLAQAPNTGREAPALALEGYDPVAYFTDGKPAKGSPEFRHDWDDARYWFTGAQHRATFIANPERYAPQFGALCATGLSLGKRVRANPEIWRIVSGKLYVFASSKARDIVDKDPTVLQRARDAYLKTDKHRPTGN